MMVVFSKLLTAFLLPPGIFVLLLVLVAFLKKSPLRAILTGTFALVLYFLSMEPAADLLIRPLEDQYPPLLSEQIHTLVDTGVDALVILGGGTVANSPEEGERGTSLGDESFKRSFYGARIYKQLSGMSTPLKVIPSGGKVFDVGQDPEAVAMGWFLEELGVPLEHIQPEPNSRNTWQNAVYVVQRYAPRRILLVTSAYHMPRGVWSFQQMNVEIIPAPTDYKSDRHIPYSLESYLPTLDSFADSYKALHEYLGLFLYKLSYGK